MNTQVRIHGSPALRRRYQELLTQEWCERTFRGVLTLTRDELESSGLKLVFDWERPPKPAPAGREPLRVPPAASDYLKKFLEQMNADFAPHVPAAIPEQRPDEKAGLAHEATQAAVYVTFQTRADFHLTGDVAFLRDTQSLLFELALLFLLPKLRSKHLEEEHDYLLNALYAHANVVWTDSPPHRSFLCYLFFDYIGDKKRARDLLLASLLTTDPGDHDYLSKAQAYWSCLMEDELWDAARSFIVRQIRRVPEEYLPELQDMLDDTYRASKRYSLPA